jgi:hypothetical protein
MFAGHTHVKKQPFNSRRRTRRVETPTGIWAFWRCGRAEDTSRVRDLSAAGLFLETAKVCAVDSTVELHFLVEEGDVRANAAIRHVTGGRGLGLQFKSVRGEDQTRFSTMMKRLIQPAERVF